MGYYPMKTNVIKFKQHLLCKYTGMILFNLSMQSNFCILFHLKHVGDEILLLSLLVIFYILFSHDVFKNILLYRV